MNIKFLKHIPNEAGIYFFKDKKWNILYIGKAKNLHKRIAQYFSPNSVWKQEMLAQADTIDFLIVKNESEALYLEDNLIKKNKPEFNNLLKADNSYAYIKITNDQFPQIFLTRKKYNDGSIYIGPKHNTIHLKKFLQYLRQILQFRGCKNTQFKQGKLCSDYYFWLCKGWCTMSPWANAKGIKATDSSLCSEWQSPIKQYQKIIWLIESFFKGNTHPIQYEIKSQIEQAVKAQNFERAGKLRDIYVTIDDLAEQQTVVIQKPITGYLAKIKKVWTFRLYCVCNFYEGKLIDVIRGKERVEDMDEDELQKSIEREFASYGERWTANGKRSTLSVNHSPLFISSSIRHLSKHDVKEISALMERFFDSYVISTSFEGDNLNNNILADIQSRYHLSRFPYRIECIDISHLSGGWISGGLSCFVEGLKNPKGYRRYKIKWLVPSTKYLVDDKRQKDLGTRNWELMTKGDDYAALSELIERRIQTWTLPDLLVLDWGKGQLGIIKKLRMKNELRKKLDAIDIISLGKGEARKKSNIGKATHRRGDDSSRLGLSDNKISETIYYFDDKGKIQSQDLLYDEVDKLLLKARDEAHRFANAYRKKQMSKEFLPS